MEINHQTPTISSTTIPNMNNNPTTTIISTEDHDANNNNNNNNNVPHSSLTNSVNQLREEAISKHNNDVLKELELRYVGHIEHCLSDYNNTYNKLQLSFNSVLNDISNYININSNNSSIDDNAKFAHIVSTLQLEYNEAKSTVHSVQFPFQQNKNGSNPSKAQLLIGNNSSNYHDVSNLSNRPVVRLQNMKNASNHPVLAHFVSNNSSVSYSPTTVNPQLSDTDSSNTSNSSNTVNTSSSICTTSGNYRNTTVHTMPMNMVPTTNNNNCYRSNAMSSNQQCGTTQSNGYHNHNTAQPLTILNNGAAMNMNINNINNQNINSIPQIVVHHSPTNGINNNHYSTQQYVVPSGQINNTLPPLPPSYQTYNGCNNNINTGCNGSQYIQQNVHNHQQQQEQQQEQQEQVQQHHHSHHTHQPIQVIGNIQSMGIPPHNPSNHSFLTLVSKPTHNGYGSGLIHHNMNMNATKTEIQNLPITMIMNGNNKKWKCPYSGCSYSTDRKGDMTRHSRIHTKEKPFNCQVCGKAFRQKNHVKKHMRMHIGEKAFKCKDCGKSFDKNQDLFEHNKHHLSDKPWQCQQCKKRFTRCASLKRHNQQKHSNINQQQIISQQQITTAITDGLNDNNHNSNN